MEPTARSHPSTGQSGVPSSVSFEQEYPRILNFDDWTPGVLDRLRAQPRPPPVCHPPLRVDPRRPHDDDDSGDDNGLRGPSHGLFERGKQALNIMCWAGGSSRTGGDGRQRQRQRTRSPPSSRRWAAGEEDESRGRKLRRDDHTSPRCHDPMRTEDAEWEHRRSRSPVRKTLHGEDGWMGIAEGDLGSALLSGALPSAQGAPPPPPQHPDPMMDFYKDTCTGDI